MKKYTSSKSLAITILDHLKKSLTSGDSSLLPGAKELKKKVEKIPVNHENSLYNDKKLIDDILRLIIEVSSKSSVNFKMVKDYKTQVKNLSKKMSNKEAIIARLEEDIKKHIANANVRKYRRSATASSLLGQYGILTGQGDLSEQLDTADEDGHEDMLDCQADVLLDSLGLEKSADETEEMDRKALINKLHQSTEKMKPPLPVGSPAVQKPARSNPATPKRAARSRNASSKSIVKTPEKLIETSVGAASEKVAKKPENSGGEDAKSEVDIDDLMGEQKKATEEINFEPAPTVSEVENSPIKVQSPVKPKNKAVKQPTPKRPKKTPPIKSPDTTVDETTTTGVLSPKRRIAHTPVSPTTQEINVQPTRRSARIKNSLSNSTAKSDILPKMVELEQPEDKNMKNKNNSYPKVSSGQTSKNMNRQTSLIKNDLSAGV